ncbi:hypothetical protein KM043_005164 [Ampulex compressa]|nr:hypothetical protein KM043_005164 [Ampulex compressa]
MSVYSLDSLENADGCSSRSCGSTSDEEQGYNLREIETSINLPFHSNPTSSPSPRVQGVSRRGPPVRSPKGSTPSICGDKQLDRLTEDDTRASLPDTSRDLASELAFYERLIEGSNGAAFPTARSAEVVARRSSFDSPDGSSAPSDEKLPRKPGYRPYTIEEYRNLPVPKPDRSLGPDIVEVRSKREWLMRRRSYGDSVSARNRQQILLRAQKLKSRRDAAQKCSLPALRNRETDSKEDESLAAAGPTDTEKNCRKNRSEVSSGRWKRNAEQRKATTSWRSKGFQGKTSISSYAIVEDAYLESLRQRHLREKELIDCLISRASRF